MRYRLLACAVLPTTALIASPAIAGPLDKTEIADGVTIDPIIDLNLRYESVSQDNAVGDADALTLRGRAGVEIASGGFSFLGEGEGTFALADEYNDTIPSNAVEPFSVVADPENIELNRLQVAFMQKGNGLIVGRQRIIHGNARFVGNVGWRQNEQTFDAVSAKGKFGPVSVDASYAISQRTIFGNDSPNEHFDGDFIFFNAAVDTPVVKGNAFAYLLDYDTRIAFSSDTYGLAVSAAIPLGAAKLNLSAAIATQSEAGANPTAYTAPYFNLEAGTSVAGFGLAAGYEELGSDDGVAAFQTPMATLHAFNGWADLFLTTPAAGIRDYYGKVTKGFSVPGVAKFNAAVVYHQFDSDFGSTDYGSEWDASLGFAIGPVGILAKYANYNADGFGVDTEKFWLQAGIKF